MRKFLSSLLLLPSIFASLASCGVEQAQGAQTREQLISSYAVLFRSLDKDHDGKLSRVEVGALVDHFMEVEGRGSARRPTALVLANERAQLMTDFAREDTDHDGYLTLREILREPLAMFDCKDRNQDRRRSSVQLSSQMKQCSSAEQIDHG